MNLQQAGVNELRRRLFTEWIHQIRNFHPIEIKREKHSTYFDDGLKLKRKMIKGKSTYYYITITKQIALEQQVLNKTPKNKNALWIPHWK